MSRNPNYTGEQTYTIPYVKDSIVNTMYLTAIPKMRGLLSQKVANRNAAVPDHIRPKNESSNWIYDYQPTYNPPTKEVFNLDIENKRRSSDKSILQ